MTRADITRALDEEISRLQHVKQLLQGKRELAPTLNRLAQHQPTRTTRVMSDEGRRRIVEAQRRRWAREKGL
jgi:hypothetical protein